MESVRAIRQEEIDVLKWVAKLWALVNFTFATVPFLMTLATFVTYIYSSPNNNLTAEKIFVSLTVFNIMSSPLVLFPLSLLDTIKLFVSIGRINKFMNAEELERHTEPLEDLDQDQDPLNPENCVEVENASFTWENRETPILSDINISIKTGELIRVLVENKDESPVKNGPV